MPFYHVNPILGCIFYCWSTDADYEFYIRCENFDDVDKAMEIADEELTKWGAPQKEELGDDYEYYYNVGYIEVVENAFKKADICATFFAPLDKKEDK